MPLIIPAFLSIPVQAEIGNVQAEAMTANTVEYCSNDVSQDILDDQTITSTLTITEIAEIADIDVKININHMWISDLRVYLISPDNTKVELFTYVGHDEGEFDNTILDNEASLSITSGSSPFDGSYKPEGNLSNFYGKSITGTWTLEVSDDYTPDTGTLNSWCLMIEKVPDEPITAPVIHSEPTVPGGICNKVSWEMPDNAQEYQSSSSVNIPSNGTKTLTQFINDFGIIEDLNVKIDIRHGWVQELDAYLIAPDGTRVELFTDVGGSSDNFHNTIFDSEAPQSITDGTGPFTGSFRPEGNLDDLIGKDIHGTWILEITDDGWNSSGTVESWSLIAERANVLFKVQCATASNFSTVIDQSGWIMDNSYTFTGLDPNQVYWFRVKARPLETWHQTSKSDFEKDTLINTLATNDGDVTLPLSDSNGQADQVHVIDNPSFESEGFWLIATDNTSIAAGGCPGDLWSSHGYYSACILFSDDYSYAQGDRCIFMQMVNWTEVDTLNFDFCTIFGSDIKGSIVIGDTEVWSKRPSGGILDAQYNITVDVSAFHGQELLMLVAEVQRTGWYTAGLFWDDFKTYRSINQTLSGNIISEPIHINSGDTFDIVTFNSTTPTGTELKIDVLPTNGSTPIAGYRNTLNGTDLSDIALTTIKLRANLSSSVPSVTPMLHDWSVSYTNAALESGWSNAVSSQCN